MSDRAAALAPSVIAAGTNAAVIHFSSVSQVQSFELCARRWWFDKVAGKPQPTSPRQAIGIDGHAQVEAYLMTGVAGNLGRLARAGMHFLPDPRTVETELAIHEGDDNAALTAAGVIFRGYVDVLNTGATWRDDDGAVKPLEDAVEIIDWKFLGDLKWAKTPAQLVESTQMVGYAEWVRRNYDVTSVRVSHGSFQTQGAAAARKTSAVIMVETVRESWQKIEETVARMKIAARAPRADDVAPTYSACGAYGGCHYREICPRTPGAAIKQLFGIRRERGDDMSLLDKYRKKVAEPTAEVRAEIEKLRAEAATIGVAMGATGTNVLLQDATPEVTPEQFVKLSEGARVAALFPQDASGIVKKELAAMHPADVIKAAGYTAEKAVGVLPPDAPKSEPPKSAQAIPPEALATMHPAIQEVAKQFAVDGVAVEVKAPAVGPGEGHTGGTIVIDGAGAGTVRRTVGTATVVLTQEQAKIVEVTKKGRPKKDKLPPTVTEKEAVTKMLDAATADEKMAIARFAAIAGPVALADEKPSDLRARVAASLEHATIIVDGGITLQVDVITAGFTSVDLESYVAQKCRALEKEFGAVDIRCAPADSALGFGKWKGALAALVRDEPPAPGVYLLNDVRGSEIREVVVEALRPLCAAYVRGR